jgi:hypothetical protein
MNLFDALLRMRSYAPNGPHLDWADRIEEEINTLSAANDWSKGEIERLQDAIAQAADACNHFDVRTARAILLDALAKEDKP